MTLLVVGASGYLGGEHVAGPEAVGRVELGVLVAHRYGYDPAAMRTSTIVESGLPRPAEVRLDSFRATGLLTTRLRGVRVVLVP